MATVGSQTSYDDLPYEGGPVPGSHPDRLAVIGRLFGMQPKDVTNCRVLEIGCALGGNLLPMAHAFPNSQFVGIDASTRQVEMGRALIAEHGVTNLELIATDVRDIAGWDQRFDYIICHGVLTWVPPDVQDAIAAACRALLAPQGIAYVSYNALPGFHMRAGIGEMMRYHARNFSDPAERSEQARALLEFLVKTTERFVPNDPDPGGYHQLLAHELRILNGAPNYYLAHEHLVDEPTAFYLHEFLEFIAPHGLQYLGDSDLHTMMLRDLPDDVAASVNSIAVNQAALEQYRDFIVNRMFRRSLVCRSEEQLVRHISTDAIKSCSYRINTERPEGKPWTIRKVGGFGAVVSDSGVAAVLDALDAAMPSALDFETLAARLPEGVAADEERLCAILLSLLSLDAIVFRTWSPETATTISERPAAFEPAAKSAAAGFVTLPTPYHDHQVLHPFVARMVPLLDGTRTGAEVAAAMKSLLDSGELVLDEQPKGEAIAPAEAERLVNDGLELLRRAGLLVS